MNARQASFAARYSETVADRDRRARVAWLRRQVNTHTAGRQAAARAVLGCGCPRCVKAYSAQSEETHAPSP